MLKPILVFDFETDTANPLNANPVEVAAKVIDPFTLEFIEGSEFHSNIKPCGIDSPDYLDLNTELGKARESTINFHCKVKNTTQSELLKLWKSFPEESTVWPLFSEHINKYNKTKQQYDAPIAAGQNIINFDMPIVNRLNEKYNIKRMFNHEIIDLRHLAFFHLIWDTSLRSRSMDSLRDYFGVKDKSGHTAMKDVDDCGLFICRFLKYCRAGFRRDKFRGAFSEVNQ